MVAKSSWIAEIVTSLKKKPLGIVVLATLNLMASIFYFLTKPIGLKAPPLIFVFTPF